MQISVRVHTGWHLTDHAPARMRALLQQDQPLDRRGSGYGESSISILPDRSGRLIREAGSPLLLRLWRAAAWHDVSTGSLRGKDRMDAPVRENTAAKLSAKEVDEDPESVELEGRQLDLDVVGELAFASLPPIESGESSCASNSGIEVVHETAARGRRTELARSAVCPCTGREELERRLTRVQPRAISSLQLRALLLQADPRPGRWLPAKSRSPDAQFHRGAELIRMLSTRRTRHERRHLQTELLEASLSLLSLA